MYNSKPYVAIVDHGMGNLFSVQQACNFVGLNAVITSDRNCILNASGLILPGVGAFPVAMTNLSNLGLIPVIKEFIETGKPFWGICLGMQLLFSESEEFGVTGGLNIIDGSVLKFSQNLSSRKEKIKVPFIGWNKIKSHTTVESTTNPLDNINDEEYMYFVHSYFVVPENENIIASTTDYSGINYCSSILKNNIFATQFHPEKSAHEGLKIYANWAKLIKKG